MSVTSKKKAKKRTPIWRVVAVINSPVQLVENKPPATRESMPQKLTTIRRIPFNATFSLGDITVSTKPWPKPLPHSLPPGPSGIPDEPVCLVSFIKAQNSELVMEKLEPFLESILDDFSFQLQTAIRVIHLNILDVTPPVAVGMTRDYFEYPSGYPSAKFFQSIPLGNIKTSFSPRLSTNLLDTNSRIRAAMRWYVKGMASPYEADRFILFWVALEILRTDSEVSVSGPYRAKCGHEIPSCPICGAETAREELGKSIKQFLTEQLGISEESANTLWQFRQMLHGANDLTNDAVSELPQRVLDLRRAVVAALKMALGLSPEASPLILGDALLINPCIGLGGKRQVEPTDIDIGVSNE